MTEPLLEVSELVKHYPIRRGLFGRESGQVRAVDGVSFDVRRGEVLGLVGESGCGKTTTGRCILRLIEPTSGTVRFDGRDITRLSRRELRPLRRQMQVIFQDPYSSLNPRLTVGSMLGEALAIHGLARGAKARTRVAELLELVGLSPDHARLIVADEPVSALDVSIQAQIVNLLQELQRKMGLTYLFVAHDLSVVEHISDRVAVMYLGRIVELAGAEALYRTPRHPYTLSLLSAIPVPDPERRRSRIVLTGDVPSPASPPAGCRFHPRCPIARERCFREQPALCEVAPGHASACHFAGELADPGVLARTAAAAPVGE
jgi:oligopeptide/dipeptide ABC transporter ATP-binding protein